MTAGDRDEFRGILKDEIGRALELAQAHTDDSIQKALASANAHTHDSIRVLRDEMVEVMRDMQTGMLRGLERFSRGNFSRFHLVARAPRE
jgi:hypothetical protein